MPKDENATYSGIGFRETVNAIRSIVAYSWTDEKRDFERMTEAGENTENHIFRDLQRLDNFLLSVASWNYPTI